MKPDKKKLSYTLLNPPKKTAPQIIFGTTALKFIAALVDLHSEEVGFYAIVDDRGDYTYFVRDVFYPKHSEAHMATCEISPEGETKMMEWLIEHNREDDIEKVQFWGHSHVGMDTEPSAQDEKQAIERMKSTGNILIRAICNKSGQMAISFFDPHKQIRFDHIKWTVEDDTPDNLNQDTLNDITSIIESEVPFNEKLKGIKKIIEDDIQVNSIRKKIIELKNVNLPDKLFPKYPHPHNRSGFDDNYPFPSRLPGKSGQTSLFKNNPSYQEDAMEEIEANEGDLSNITHPQDDLEHGYQRNMNQDDINDFSDLYDENDRKQIEELLNNWENDIWSGS